MAVWRRGDDYGVASERMGHGESANGHLTGHVRIFGGSETTVFQKYKLFYEFRFAAAPVRDVAMLRQSAVAAGARASTQNRNDT